MEDGRIHEGVTYDFGLGVGEVAEGGHNVMLPSFPLAEEIDIAPLTRK